MFTKLFIYNCCMKWNSEKAMFWVDGISKRTLLPFPMNTWLCPIVLHKTRGIEFSLSLKLKFAYLIQGILFEVRAGNGCSSTSPASFLVIKTDFHSSAYAKDLTYIIFLWLLIIYQSAVRQKNREDHSFLQKQLSWTSTTCVLHHFVFKFRSVSGYKRSFSFKLFSISFSCHI